MKTFDLVSYLSQKKQVVSRALEQALPGPETFPPTLHKAMLHSLSAGGKRLRPILCLAACEAAGGQETSALGPACALELIHTYSLIHDDLPCMDDDDLRRGLPTCHKVFGEAVAVLAGDSLLTRAFEVAASCELSDRQVREIILLLSQAAGSQGMCGGQTVDLEAEGKNISLEELGRIHALKTGALLKAALRCGAVAGKADEKQAAALARFGQKAGMAFQVSDDILDVTGNAGDLGKTPGKDAAQQKATYVTLLGLKKSQEILEQLRQESIEALSEFGNEAQPLRAIADYIATRDR